MTEHAKKYPPSAAGRWMTCTASPLLIEELIRDKRIPPRSKSGGAALNGTAMHSGAQFVLGDDARDAKRDLPGFKCKETGIVLSKDHANIVDPYVRLVREKRDRDGGLLIVEKRVHLSDDCFGTVDAGIVSAKRLRVWDLKTGKGKAVFAKNNFQIGIYGAGLLRELEDLYDFNTIELGISQPSLDHTDRVIHSRESLTEIGQQVVEMIAQIEKGDVDFAPDEDTCHWCPAAPFCPAIKREKIDVAMSDFNEVVTREEREIEIVAAQSYDSSQDLDWGKRLEIVSILKVWCKEVEDTAKRLMLNGQIPEDDSMNDKFKIVTGREGNRVFKSPADNVGELARRFDLAVDQVFEPPTPKSPSAIEKVIAESPAGKKLKKREITEIVNEMTDREPGSPTIVPMGDPRPPVDRNQAALKDFASIDDAE